MPVVPTLLLELGSLQRGPSSSTDSGQEAEEGTIRTSRTRKQSESVFICKYVCVHLITGYSLELLFPEAV